MSKQTILAVDDKGNFTGEYVDKEEAHTGEGKHHLAITVILTNSSEQILLQKRKHKRFDNIWDGAGATHQLHLEDGRDETDEQATLRCLKDEWGITQVEKLDNLGGFNYFAKDGNNCENEFCKLLVAKYDGEVKLNEEAGYEYKWIGKRELLGDIDLHPESYTPWVVEAVKLLKQNNFFN